MLKDPVYLDTSAIVKLIVDEPETGPLKDFLSALDAQMTTSVITGVECVRAVARQDPGLAAVAQRALDRFILLPLTTSITLRAADFAPASLRSLDAIHLATAVEVQPSLAGFLSYDNRLNEAALTVGIEASSPA